MNNAIFLENHVISNFSNKNNIGLIHRAYTIKFKKSRTRKASTKTKGEISGGGKKPWKQKGTGKARAGSNRSPLWRGGGIIFGPKFKKVTKKINKKELKLAFIAALCLKKKSIVELKSLAFLKLLGSNNSSFLKTKMLINFLLAHSIHLDEKVLLIVPKELSEYFYKIFVASKNLKNLEIIHENMLNLSIIIKYNKILIFKPFIEFLKNYTKA